MSDDADVFAVASVALGLYAGWSAYVVPKFTSSTRSLADLLLLRRSDLRKDLDSLRGLRAAVVTLALAPTLGVIALAPRTFSILRVTSGSFSWIRAGIVGCEILWIVCAIFGWIRIRNRRRQVRDTRTVFAASDDGSSAAVE